MVTGKGSAFSAGKSHVRWRFSEVPCGRCEGAGTAPVFDFSWWSRTFLENARTFLNICSYEIGRSASRRARHGSRLVAMNITRWSQSLVGAAHSEAASSRTDAVLFIQTRSHFQEKEKRIQQSKIYQIYAKKQDLQDLRRKFYTSGPAAVGIFTNSCRRQYSWPGDPPLARSQVHRLVHHWCQGVRTPRGRFGPQPFVQ